MIVLLNHGRRKFADRCSANFRVKSMASVRGSIFALRQRDDADRNFRSDGNPGIKLIANPGVANDGSHGIYD